jgi:hypothetical protein
MKLIKGKKRCECKTCGTLICSNDYKFVGVDGVHCFYHGKIIKLHNASIKWIKRLCNVKN